jgi:hypothetical protein
MNEFEKLTGKEQEELLKFPVYVTLLAANADGTTDEEEKNTAIAFDHTKTYTSDILLAGFYERSDTGFKMNLEKLDAELPKGSEERKSVIQQRLAALNNLLTRLGPDYAAAMHKSMRSFKEHVSRAHHHVLEDFLFPIPIKGLTDKR